MTLDEFKTALSRIDAGCGVKDKVYFNCGAEDKGDGLFKYLFDGWVNCHIVIRANGCVDEWVADPAPDIHKTPPLLSHANLEEWIADTTRRMKYSLEQAK